MFLILPRSYIVDQYKDQINQNVVGDISFGRFDAAHMWPMPCPNSHSLFILGFTLPLQVSPPPINFRTFAE